MGVAQQELELGAETFFGRLGDAVRRVVIFEDTAALPCNVPDCLTAQTPATVPTCDVPNAGQPEEAMLIAAERAASSAAGPPIAILSVDDIACPDDTCAALSPDGIIPFHDTSHMTLSYSASLAAQVGDRLWSFLMD